MNHHNPDPAGTAPWGAPVPTAVPGSPYPHFQPPRPPTQSSPSGEAIASLVLAFLSMTVPCFPIGLASMYFGRKARRAAMERGDPTGADAVMGLIGMIAGGIFAGLWLLLALFYVAMMVMTLGFAVLGAAASH